MKTLTRAGIAQYMHDQCGYPAISTSEFHDIAFHIFGKYFAQQPVEVLPMGFTHPDLFKGSLVDIGLRVELQINHVLIVHNNPLQSQYMLKTGSPFSLILFGASGHLATLKLYPALYILALKKRLPKEYAVIGFARSSMDDGSFRALVAEAVRKDMCEVNETMLENFLAHVNYHRGEYATEADFAAIAKKLATLEHGWKDVVRLAYLSVPPAVFAPVLHGLCAGKVHSHSRGGDFRCIVEKPVGQDIESFESIERALTACFEKNEIFLIDHYLGKEAVRNIYYLRFANPILERLLKNTLIHHVEITALEDGGTEGRTGYFDHVGTFRDMFQSHLLEIVSLLTMRMREEE